MSGMIFTHYSGMSHKNKQSNQGTGASSRTSGKVGSDREADKQVGGKLDFGIPARKAVSTEPEGGRAKGPEQGTGPMRSGDRGVRTSGVGHAPGKPGTGSGGDLDTDFIGLDGKGGLSSAPASGRTSGPDITAGGSAPFASGPPAKGENEHLAHNHGASPSITRGTTVNRDGGDATTTGFGGGADSALANDTQPQIDDPAVGEITLDEASGQK
jgi:hypothetical protein